MTNEKQEEAGPVTVQIGVCGSCHALFMLSGDRLTSPCHGADPLAVLATLTIGPDGQVAGEWGMGAPIGEGDITEEPAPAPAPLEEPPAEDAREVAPLKEMSDVELLMVGIQGLLVGEGTNADAVKDWLTRMGAEPEAASTAVGRLVAVRELVQSLASPREAVPVAPAPPEAESSPTNT